MSRIRWMKVSRLMAFVAMVPMVLPLDRPVLAAEPVESAAQEASAQVPRSMRYVAADCRLNFLRKPWSEVLQKVAEETNSALVMPETPPGKFTRADLARHSREEAVRILNRDLEKAGYRLLEKDDVLEVISVKRRQPEYERHQVSEDTAPAVAVPGAAPIDMSSPPASPADAAPGKIQRVNHETPAPPAITTVTIQPVNRPALEIAKQMHVTFKQRSRLENSGPHQLPAFIVDHFDEEAKAAGQPLFVLEIDTEKNELILTAEESVLHGLKQLISKVDVNPLGAHALPRLMAGNGTTAATGRQLVQPLQLIAQSREDSRPAATPLLEKPADSAQPGATDAAPSATEKTPPSANAASGGLPALLGNLKGDVAIEALNDLDLLILRGNEKDVEAVMQVIRAIEQMAMGSLPEVHLLRLRYVDSQSMSQLLNDVYTRMTELRTNNAQQSQASVRVMPVVTPNAVLILAPSNAMEAVLQLADELDQAVDPTHEVQVFRLKHAVAPSVVEMLTAFYTQPPVGLGTRLKVAADARTNSIVVQAQPRDMSEIAEFIRGLDNEQAAATNRMRIFPLKSAGAEDLAAFLNNAIQGALNPPRMMATTTGQGGLGQQAQQGAANAATQQVRATVLEFLAEGGQELIRSGLLNDIRFNADPRTNSLLVTASEQSMPLIEELIRLLDRPSNALAEIKVFTLKNADAINAVTLLEELFNSTGNQGQNSQASALGMELLGTQGSGSNLIPLRFSTDARTNSVVAIGGADALRIVEAILYKLDSNNARDRQTTVIKLRNSPAADVAAAINEFLTAQRELATIDPNRISTSQLLEQEIIVTAEPITNSLLISATPTYFKQLEEIAKRLDAEPAQVVIQAMMVEVVLDNTDEFGVELGFQDPVLFARSAIADLVTTTTTTAVPGVGNVQTTNIVSQSATPGFNFNNNPLGNNNSASNPQTVGTQGLSSFGMGRTNSDLGYGGLVLSASSDSVSVLIRALAARRTLRVLSRPQVLALDNQQAQVQVGQVVPVPNGVNLSSTGLSQTNVLRDPAGIILTVSPRISPEGQIVMEVAAEKSAYPNLSGGVPIGSDGNGGFVYAPVKDITTARTTVKVPDGQTIVVGGMITKNDQTTERKVPFLGDLPMVGKLFRFDSFQFKRTELLIFLTPRIVHGDADMEQIKQVEAGRMHFFQDDVESLHGPVFGVPPEMTYPLDALPPVKNSPKSIFPAPAVEPKGDSVPPSPTPHQINPASGAKAIEKEGRSVKRLGDAGS